MSEPPDSVPSSSKPVEYRWTWWRIFIAAYLFALAFGVLGRLSNGIIRLEVMDFLAPAGIAAVVALGWWLLRGRQPSPADDRA